MNFIETKVVKQGEDIILAFGNEEIKLPQAKAKKLVDGGYVGKEVIMGIRPEDLHDEAPFIEASPTSTISANVEVTEMLGAEVYLYMVTNGQNLTARVDPKSEAKPGDKIKIALDVNHIHIFDKDTELTITN
jgi:multiple sugar transport system ATP-binding protein